MNELKIEKPKELINLTDRKINRHKQSDKESENTFNCFLFLNKMEPKHQKQNKTKNKQTNKQNIKQNKAKNQPVSEQVPPRFELGSLDSESRVLTITPWNHMPHNMHLAVLNKTIPATTHSERTNH